MKIELINKYIYTMCIEINRYISEINNNNKTEVIEMRLFNALYFESQGILS